MEQTRLGGLPGKLGFGEFKSEKYPRESNGRSRSDRGILGKREKVFIDWNFVNSSRNWRQAGSARGGRRSTYRGVPSLISNKTAKKSQTRRMKTETWNKKEEKQKMERIRE